MAVARLVQFTDTHLVGDPAGTLRGIATLSSLRRVLDVAADDLASADAVLVTGDIVQDEPSGYAHLRSLLAPLGKPVWCLPGNHDEPVALRKALEAIPFACCPVRDLDAWRIVLLDSVVPGEVSGTLAPGELERLELALAGARGPVLIALHHPPIPSRSRWLDPIGLTNSASLWAIIDRHPNVRGVLWGHVHQEQDEHRGHVRCLATPSTCLQYAPEIDEFTIDTRPPAYRRLTLHPDGRIDSEVVWCR